MAATVTTLDGGIQAKKTEFGAIAFTSTTATVEVATALTTVTGFYHGRIGTVDAVNGGHLTFDETVTAGIHTVGSGAITLDRGVNDPAGTLGTEAFFYLLIGT